MDPYSKACYSRIAKCIDYCDASHPKCKLAEATDLPSQVISVGQDKDSSEPALIEPNHLTGKYIALSYC